MGTVDVSIVTWNSGTELIDLLKSLSQQTLKPQNIFVIDNGSTDNSVAIAKAEVGVQVFEQDKNFGFSKGHNIGISKSQADYILVVNPDITLSTNYLSELVSFADAHPEGAAFVGVVKNPDGQIDSLGLKVTPWRIVHELKSFSTNSKEVFGVSGAVALYRRSALQQVITNNEYFCNLLFAYKEDVELAWRLRWAGWTAYYMPSAIAIHRRELKSITPRSQRSVDRRYLSYRNHLLLYALTETPETWLPHILFIGLAEIARFLFLIFTDPIVTIHALADAAKMWHAARTFARATIRKITARNLRAAF